MSKMMEDKQKTPSVIARLMGLDELPSQQPLHRNHKVLSDDYLRKTASIGLLEKRSSRDGLLCKTSAEKQDMSVCRSEMFDGKPNANTVSADFSVPRLRNSHTKYPLNEKKLFHLKGLDDMLEGLCDNRGKHFGGPKGFQSRLSASTSTSVSDDSDGELFNMLDKMIHQRGALRSIEKVENSYQQTYIDPLDKLKPQLDFKDRSRSIVVLKPNSRRAKQINSSSSFRGLSRSRVTPDECSPNVSDRISCQSSFNFKRIDQISYPFPSGSIFSVEAKKQIIERWRTTKNFQEVEVDGRRCTLGEMFTMHDDGARPKTSISHEGGKLELGSSRHVNGKYGSTVGHIQDLPRLELFKRPIVATGNSNLTTIGEASQHDLKNKASLREHSLKPRVNTDLASEDQQQLEVAPGISLSKDEHTSSDVWENLTPQRSSCGTPSGESNSWCTSDSSLAMNFKEINQLSPDSVLEPPIKEGNSFVSEFSNSPLADLSGLAMKLELLESKSEEETNSECSGMNVSSDDEENENESVDVPKYNKRLWEMFGLEESRDFSYLVDVLDEAHLSDNIYEAWDSTDLPVDPSLFELLEKKYGKQTSWLKTDRKLLFDRINYGLKEIVNTFVDINSSRKPLRRRIDPQLRRNEIEEELWMLLVDQEKEVNKDLPAKALGREIKWLSLEEDISIICREIEEFLFNELAAELD